MPDYLTVSVPGEGGWTCEITSWEYNEEGDIVAKTSGGEVATVSSEATYWIEENADELENRGFR